MSDSDPVVFVALYSVIPPTGGASRVTLQCATGLSAPTILLHCGAWSGVRDGLMVYALGNRPEGAIPKLASGFSRIPAIISQIRALEPRVVVIEGASWAGFLWALIRGLRMADFQGPVLYHAHNVDRDIRAMRYGVHGSLVARITEVLEGNLLRRADAATAVSPADQNRLADLYHVATELVPNGVDTDRFSPEHRDRDWMQETYGTKDRTVLYVGAYSYPPNREAIEWAVKTLGPSLAERGHPASLLVVGSDVPLRREWLIAPGHVPEEHLQRIYASVDVLAVPLTMGSGTRLKILEALASGTPVVSTPKGAEGLILENLPGLLVAEREQEMIDTVAHVLGKPPGEFDEILEKTRSSVRDFYDWRAVTDRLESIVRSLA